MNGLFGVTNLEFSQAAMIGQGARPGFPDQAVDKQIPILCLAT